MKKKYAMVGINSRQNEKLEEVVRRVLIEYKKYKNNEFYGTRFIEKDPYFYDPNSSHQYIFRDDSYTLIEDFYGSEDHIIGVDRKYHYNPLKAILYNLGNKLEPILFKAESDEEAIKMFNERNELR